MERLRQDLAYALRLLLKDRAFTSTTLLTLALCVAANAAIFAVGQDAVTLDFAQHVASGCKVKGMSVPGGVIMPDHQSQDVVWLVLANVDRGWDVLRYNLSELGSEVDYRKKAVLAAKYALTEAEQVYADWRVIFDKAEQVTIPV